MLKIGDSVALELGGSAKILSVLGSGGLSDNMIYEVNTSLTVEDVGGYIEKPTVKSNSN